MALDWTNKINNVDNVDANDVNTLAGAIKDVEQSVTTEDGKLTDHKTKAVLDHPDSSVTTNKIANNAVTDTKISDGAVTTLKIGKSAVDTDNIKDAAVDSAKIVNGSIAARHIMDGEVTRDKIAAGSITSDKIANESVTTEKIADVAVTTEKIKDNAVTDTKISDGEISETKLTTALSEKINGKANSSDVYTKAEADTKLDAKENIANKVAEISDTSTDVQYPSAKAVNDVVSAQKTDMVQNYANALKGKVTGNNAVRIDDSSPIEHEMNVRVSSKNVIPYPYVETTKTVSGITFTDNGDGTITANGTATATVNFLLSSLNSIPFTKGNYVLTSGVNNDNEDATFGLSFGYKYRGENRLSDGTLNGIKHITLTDDAMCDFVIVIREGQTISNIIFKPQFERGTTATDYTPYVDPTSVTLSEYGKNLINSDLWKTPITDGGITASYLDENDCFMLNGSATRDSNARVNTLIPLKNVPSMLSASYVSGTLNLPKGYGIFYLGKGDSPSEQINFVASNKFSTGTIAPVSVNLTDKKYISRMWFYTSRGNSYDNYKVKIQLEVGSNETAYEPYKSVKTFTPSADGTVTGIKNIYPTTTLLSDTDGVVIDVEYNRDINKAFEELQNAILAQGGNV